ncbi:MAG: HD domain-containing protein [Bacteroidales bacterium]|nr:HD domain-containing protein [Bacteroidales bacterium]
MNLIGAKKYILDKLKKELKPYLFYHSIDHTIDVLYSTERIAKMENINGYELNLLKSAALYHDSGFIIKYQGHEEASIQIARDVLPNFGYKPDEIEIISKLILATRLPQKPETLLENIIADADLDYIGRDDFFMIAQRLLYEWKINGNELSLKEWYELQLEFLQNHRFFTKSAILLRQEKKLLHIKEIKKLLSI